MMSHLMSDLLFCLFHGLFIFVFFFKQKTAYELRISDWSSDVCSSDLARLFRLGAARPVRGVVSGAVERRGPFPASADACRGDVFARNPRRSAQQAGDGAAAVRFAKSPFVLSLSKHRSSFARWRDRAALRQAQEIGRASGRARVCPSV